MGGVHGPNRRDMLLGTGALGAGALVGLISGCGTGSANTGSSSTSTLQGAWHVDVTLDDGTKHQAQVLCAQDGGIGVCAALAQDSVANGFGAWTQSGGHYLITFEAVVFTGGAFASLLRVRATPTVDQTGEHLTARAQFDIQRPGASTFTQVGGATWVGSRIKPLPLS